VSANADAATVIPVWSDITGIQLWQGQENLMDLAGQGYFSDFQFGGTVTDTDYDGYIDEADMTLSGFMGFTRNGVPVRFVFDLEDGDYSQGAGITFRGGSIVVELQSDSNWIPYDTIDAEVTSVGLLAGRPGHMVWGAPDQVTAGIVRNELPGLWDGEIGSSGFNRGVGIITFLGINSGLYLQGHIGVGLPDQPDYLLFGAPEVPVPAAAWLFGSALVGLAGLRRRRA
jgi:hypothetical protein